MRPRTVVVEGRVAIDVAVDVVKVTEVEVGSVETPEATVLVGVGMLKQLQACHISHVRQWKRRTEDSADDGKMLNAGGGPRPAGGPARSRIRALLPPPRGNVDVVVTVVVVVLTKSVVVGAVDVTARAVLVTGV